MIPTDTPHRYRLEISDYDAASIAAYPTGGEPGTISIVVPEDAVVSITDADGRLVGTTAMLTSGGKAMSFDPGYVITSLDGLARIEQFNRQCESDPHYVIVHVPEAGPAGPACWTQLESLAEPVFSTNETRRRVIPPPPPSDPLQDQIMDMPLAQDGSYEMIAVADRAAWTASGGQMAAWIASNSPARQRASAVVRASEKSSADQMRPPQRIQVELLDVTGSVPSRVVLLGSSAGGSGPSVIVSPFTHVLPLPAAVSGLADGFEWIPYGTCLGGLCEVWRDGSSGDPYAMFAFVVDLSPLMEDTILPLASAGRSLAVRFRHGSGLSEAGWPVWNGWSQAVRFEVNSLPPAPVDLLAEGV